MYYTKYHLSRNILLEPEVSGKFQPGTWALRENFHLEPDNASERQYFVSYITWCHLHNTCIYKILSSFSFQGTRFSKVCSSSTYCSNSHPPARYWYWRAKSTLLDRGPLTKTIYSLFILLNTYQDYAAPCIIWLQCVAKLSTQSEV